MVIDNDEELTKLKEIGRICADAIQVMAAAMEPGMTTLELDQIGRKVLEEAGAQSAPGILLPVSGRDLHQRQRGSRPRHSRAAGHPPGRSRQYRRFGGEGRLLCRYRRLLRRAAGQIEDREALPGRQAGALGRSQPDQGWRAAGEDRQCRSAPSRRRTAIRSIANLASHGVGRSLHEEPAELSTWPDPTERRMMTEGLVFTVEPFLSLGATWAEGGDDAWTLYADPKAPTVQYEHTVVATRNGPIILTLAA